MNLKRPLYGLWQLTGLLRNQAFFSTKELLDFQPIRIDQRKTNGTGASTVSRKERMSIFMGYMVHGVQELSLSITHGKNNVLTIIIFKNTDAIQKNGTKKNAKHTKTNMNQQPRKPRRYTMIRPQPHHHKNIPTI